MLGFQLNFLRCWSFIVIIIRIVNIKFIGCIISNQQRLQKQCPGSDVYTIREQTKYNEISILYYYTSWDEKSKEGRKLINDVANFYKDFNIYFATIDCWHLECNCTQTYAETATIGTTTLNSGSPHKWPTLMLYIGTNYHIQLEYHGEWHFTPLCTFINNALKPLERVHTFSEVDNIRKEADAIILGVFKNPYDYAYKQYTITALKWLENDPLRCFRFLISFNQTIANKMQQQIATPYLCYVNGGVNNVSNNTQQDSLKCVNNNTEGMLTLNTSNILKLLQQELKSAKYIHGYSTTPISLAIKLKFSPVLNVFPHSNDFYKIMKTIVYKESYKDNSNNNKAEVTIPTAYLQKRMKSLLFNEQQRHNDISCCTIFQNSIKPINFLKYYYAMNIILREFFYEMVIPQKLVQMQIQDSPSTTEVNVNKLQQRIQYLANNIDYKNVITLNIAIAHYLQNYVNQWQQYYNYNRTISIVVVDHNKYPDYLPSLGIIDNHQLNDKIATIFLIDNEKESIYIMEDNRQKLHNNSKTTINGLDEFLIDFFHNNLTPFKKTEDLLLTLQSQKSISKRLRPIAEKAFHLKRLNGLMFANYVQQQQNSYQRHNVTTVMLLYETSCALCANLQNIFLQLATMLRHQENYIRFYRINTQTNDMPWPFVMPTRPTLLVFAKGSYSDSRVFPSHLKVNIRNVLAFILAQMSAVDEVKLIVALCEGDTVLFASRNSCWHFVNNLTMQHIGQHLHYWQLFDTERHLIFERLSAFKDLSLNIQSHLRFL